MNPQSYVSWIRRKKESSKGLMPQADEVLPLIAQAGAGGMTRGEIGGVIDLERDVLDDLLAALVRSGLLELIADNGGYAYRTRP